MYSIAIFEDCCSDCKWGVALFKASEIFQTEPDEGRNRALISVILREGIDRFERLLKAKHPMASYWWLANAALHVSEFNMLYGNYNKAQNILEALLELTDAKSYFCEYERQIAKLDLACCYAHC